MEFEMARKKKKGTAAASKEKIKKLKAGSTPLYPLGRRGERVTTKPPGSMSPEEVKKSEAAAYGAQMEAEKERVRKELGV
jgi:hypothetical protein